MIWLSRCPPAPTPIGESTLGEPDRAGRRLSRLLREAFEGEEDLVVTALQRKDDAERLPFSIRLHLVDVAAEMSSNSGAFVLDVLHGGNDRGGSVSERRSRKSLTGRLPAAVR